MWASYPNYNEVYLTYWISESIVSSYSICNQIVYPYLEALWNFHYLVDVVLVLCTLKEHFVIFTRSCTLSQDGI